MEFQSSRRLTCSSVIGRASGRSLREAAGVGSAVRTIGALGMATPSLGASRSAWRSSCLAPRKAAAAKSANEVYHHQYPTSSTETSESRPNHQPLTIQAATTSRARACLCFDGPRGSTGLDASISATMKARRAARCRDVPGLLEAPERPERVQRGMDRMPAWQHTVRRTSAADRAEPRHPHTSQAANARRRAPIVGFSCTSELSGSGSSRYTASLAVSAVPWRTTAPLEGTASRPGP